MQDFVRAERSGDWSLHLRTVLQMVPHFHATGHLAYAKYAYLYLQQMSNLHERMTPDEFESFTSKGYFTIDAVTSFVQGSRLT